MKIVVTEEQLKKVINSNILKETVGELDKQYVKTGLFDEEERNIIIGITGGDYYTKLIADMYKYLANKYNPGAVEPRKVNDNDIKILRHAHEMLKRYNKNVFPLKDLFAKDYYTHPLGIRNDLELRELIIDRIKTFPTLLLRNLRGDIRKERGEYEFRTLFDEVRDIQNSLKLINQTNPEHRAKIEKKIFSSKNDTFAGVKQRLQDTTIPYLSQDDAGDVVIDKVQDLGDEAEVLYNKNNVMVVKINTAEAMGYIGCSSQWCFATSPQQYWDDYTGSGGFATIVFNFNEEPSEPTAMVVVLETGDVYNMYNEFMEDGYEYLRSIGVEEVIPHGSMEMSESIIREEYDRIDYLKWKKRNVTLRGIRESGSPDNGGMAKYGQGLYSAFLGNREMAKQYGKVYFLVNAIPKKPKIVHTVNDAEIFLQEVVTNFCKIHGVPRSNEFFSNKTTIADEMQRLGYDGLVIRGREMVNYKPPDNVLYFSSERELQNYYDIVINTDK